MKKVSLLYPVILVSVVIALSGCGTAQKKKVDEIQGIKTKVETLESRVEGIEMKQAEADRLATERAQMAEESRMETPSSNISTRTGARSLTRSKESIKDIQACLKNAGFYDGKVDGVKGKNTRRAVREFQKANGLTPDGVVGKKTWELLSKYSAGTK